MRLNQQPRPKAVKNESIFGRNEISDFMREQSLIAPRQKHSF
jgi:hypothetical protein